MSQTSLTELPRLTSAPVAIAFVDATPQRELETPTAQQVSFRWPSSEKTSLWESTSVP